MRRAALLAAIFLTVIAVGIASLTAAATTCDVTEFPASGTLTAERLNQRVRQTEACINGKVGNGNWNASEPLQVGNIANDQALFSQTWTIGDEDGNGTAGEVIAATNQIRQWRVYTSATVVGMSVALRCPGAGDACASASATITLQKDAATIKSFTGVTGTTPSVDFAISNAIVNTDVLNIDVAGTLTNVEFIDIAIYYNAQHQP